MIEPCPTCGNDLVSKDVGPMILCGTFHQVKWKGERVKLTPTQFNIVKVIVEHAGKPVKAKAIRETMFSQYAGDDSIRVNICTIRKAFRYIDQAFDRIHD